MARMEKLDKHNELKLLDFLRCLRALGGSVGEAAERCEVEENQHSWVARSPVWGAGQITDLDSDRFFSPEMPGGMQGQFAREMANAFVREDMIRRSIALSGGSSLWSQGEIIAGVEGSWAAPEASAEALLLLEQAVSEGLNRAQKLWVEASSASRARKSARATLAADRSARAPDNEDDAQRQAARARFERLDQNCSELSPNYDFEAMRWLALKAHGLELFEIEPRDDSTANERERAWRGAHQMLFNAKTEFDIPLLHEDSPPEISRGPDGQAPYWWRQSLEAKRDHVVSFHNPMAVALWLKARGIPTSVKGSGRLDVRDGGQGQGSSIGAYGPYLKEWSESIIARLEAEMIGLVARPGAAIKRSSL